MLTILKYHLRKVLFSVFISIIYSFVASPSLYNFVGSILGLNEYDNPNKPDRDTLLYIHAVVMGILTFNLLFMYNPMNVKSPTIN
jgi:hypothetical protein